MSIKAIKWAVKRDIKGPQKAVLLVIANRADKHGTCWPAHSTIAFDSGLSVTTVQRSLESLKDHKLIKWRGNAKEKGQQSSNIYTLLLPFRVGQSDRPPPPVGATDEPTVLERND